MPILDALTTLIPQGLNNSSQSFSALDVGRVADLATTSWVVSLTIPPAASVLFVLEAATIAAGPYVEMVRLVVPGGLSGAQRVSSGVQGNLSRLTSGTHRYLRVTTTQTGAWTGSSWLTKPQDGSFGLATDPGDITTATMPALAAESPA